MSRGTDKMHAKFEKANFDTLVLTINSDTDIDIDLSNHYETWLNLLVVHKGTSAYTWGVYTTDGTEVTSGSDSKKKTGTFDDPFIVGEDFTGYIRGVLITESAETQEVQYMTRSDISGSTFFGMDFTTEGYKSSGKFNVYGEDSGSESLASSKYIVWTDKWFKESADDLTGTIDDSDVSFDGTTCEDERESFYISEPKEQAHFDVETYDGSNGLTFEIWLRGSKPFKRNGYLFSMSSIDSNDRYNTNYMAVKVTSGQVNCYPFLDALSDTRLTFTDTDESDKQWQHVACSYSFDSQTMQGSYMTDDNDYFYIQKVPSTEKTQYKYPKAIYRFCLNCL
jgi:hypothetical protein